MVCKTTQSNAASECPNGRTLLGIVHPGTLMRKKCAGGRDCKKQGPSWRKSKVEVERKPAAAAVNLRIRQCPETLPIALFSHRLSYTDGCHRSCKSCVWLLTTMHDSNVWRLQFYIAKRISHSNWPSSATAISWLRIQLVWHQIRPLCICSDECQMKAVSVWWTLSKQ